MVGRYVVGIDESRSAQTARAWAEARALHRGAECVVIHSDDGDNDDGISNHSPRRHAFDDTVSTVPGELPGALIGQVQSDDVLVIGTGKTGFIHGRVFGSLGIHIATLAPCSVGVIPDVDVRFRSGVVAGIDRRETAAVVAAAAAEEAAMLGTPLQLLRSAPTDARRAIDDLNMAVAIAELTVRTGWPELEVRTRLVARPAAEALLDAARNAALLVLGPGRLNEGAEMPGRVLHDVLINANAPILVARGATAEPA